MRAQEISGIVRAANETDVWSNEGIDERLQREQIGIGYKSK